MDKTIFDVIVLGVGGMGSAACYHLARRGLRVLGLEQFDIAHEQGSSHGKSRVIRKAYFEDPRYVPLLHETYELWRDLERVSGERLLNLVGCLNFGPADHECIDGVRRSVAQHGLTHEILSAAEIHARWPAIVPNENDIGIFEPDGGYMPPEKCVQAHARLARAQGCEIHTNCTVLDWAILDGEPRVQTSQGIFSSRSLVITAGAWLPRIASDLGASLKIERQVQTWFAPQTNLLHVPNMPVFIHFLKDRSYYSIPDHGDGIKVARHHGGAITTPDEVDRAIRPADEADIRSYMARHLPGANGPLLDAKICLYTNTPDDHFILDRHPKHANVLIAGGFSGHGFKFCPVVGKMLADLVQDTRQPPPVEIFRLARLRA